MMKMVKERTLEPGQQVEVYFNLHKKVFSIRDKKTKLVVAHAPHVNLQNVTFKVNQKGREKTIATKRKGVHAFVVGEFVSAEQSLSAIEDLKSAYYNPYETQNFLAFNPKEKLSTATIAYCENKRVHYQ